ncbi:sigma 54-interacting transcriptional regulator [Silvibacterium acidisoli]|uniref:sigma 54-interacting transcriptional regulator n=1 Tax=Acidobacteriaceae bacterium ZG23-2 TaxID=2883246 RepID=UPI00406D47C6
MREDLTGSDLRKVFEQHGFVTGSDCLLPLLRRAIKAAEVSDVTTLIEGETGTGKQVLAQAIHSLDGKRKNNAFVTVHCSTVSESLAESELFGHQRGAFSGAFANRRGLFQAARNGTLFLDDVNDLPLVLQPKLLDVLQRGTVRPVGSDFEVPIDVRIIAAANRPLEPLVKEGRFRQDLYHRLNVVRLELPPLRERPADFASLMLTFACRHAGLYRPILSVDPELLRFLESQPILGNVRELENAVQRMLFLKTEGASLTLEDWTRQVSTEAPGEKIDLMAQTANAVWRTISNGECGYGQALQELEKRVLEAAMSVPGSTRRKVAKQLHISERALYYKMRACGIASRIR